MIANLTDPLITDFEFLKCIGESHGIIQKTDDSRYESWFRMNTEEDSPFETRTLWFATITPRLTRKGESGDKDRERRYHMSYLNSFGGFTQDCHWKRGATGIRDIMASVEYVDYYGVLPQPITSQLQEREDVVYYLFEEYVDHKGTHRVYMLKPKRLNRLSGISIFGKEKRTYAQEWIAQMFLEPIDATNRILFLEHDEYPASYLQSLQTKS